MGLFSGPSQKDVVRQQQTSLQSSIRDIEKEERNLVVQEQKLENEMKLLAKRGQEQAGRTVAEQLISSRQQRKKLMAMKAQLSSTSNQVKSIQTQKVLVTSVKASASVMSLSKKQMNPMQTQALMQAYEKESMKFSMSSEIVDETFDSVFEVDEEDESNLVSKVFDEIGLEFAQSAGKVPNKQREEKSKVTDQDVEKFLAEYQMEI